MKFMQKNCIANISIFYCWSCQGKHNTVRQSRTNYAQNSCSLPQFSI